MEAIIILAILVAVYFFFIKRKPSPMRNNTASNDGASIKIVTATDNQTSDSDQSNHDAWEGAFWDVQSPRNTAANLRIKYRDGAGSFTERDINLMKYGAWEGGAILWAYCNLRKANRTFRTDRIARCVDLDTGEVIDNLEAWLDDRYQQSPDRAIEKIIESSWDVLRVLYYVSKADGRLTQKERVVVREAVRSMSDHPEIDDRRIDEMFDAVGGLSLTAFKQAFGRLVNQNRETAIRAAVWSSDMVATEKTVSAGEQEALTYMKERLNTKI